MPGIINITFVAGTGPSYTLSVDSSSGAATGNHVICGIEGVLYDGGIYRVTGVPDSSTIVIEDDVEAAPYGKPADGPGQFYAPTTNWGLSQQVTGAYYWAEAQRRDSRIIDTYLGTGGGGGGGIAGPVSSTNRALPRWDGTGGDTLLNSGVTLSDTDAMVFPAAGSISKPSTGIQSEAFGAGAVASGNTTLAVGYSVDVASAASVAVGWDAGVDASSDGSTALGYLARVGNACLRSVSIGYEAVIGDGCENSILIGAETDLYGSAGRSIGIGFQGEVTEYSTVAIGQAVHGRGREAVAVGALAETNALGAVSLGRSAISSSTSPYAIAIGYAAQARPGADRGIIIGRYSELRDNVSYGIGMGDNCFVWHDYGMCFGRSAVTTAANRATFGQIGSGYTMELQCGEGFACFGATPPSSQPAKINDPGDLGTALTAIAAIIDVLEGAGFSSSV